MLDKFHSQSDFMALAILSPFHDAMTIQAPLDYHLCFNGSSVEIVGESDTIVFELSHPEEVDRRSGVFAAWVLLPLAMIKGRDIRIHAGGDEVTQRNFEALTQIWATWMPEHFQPAKVFFAEAYHPEKAASDCDLLLFSGGVDSTYNLLLRHEAKKEQVLLTIHGIDYKVDDPERYGRLLKKTDPLVQMVGSRRIFLKTDAYAVYKRNLIGIDVGHAFVLAAGLFLYGAKYRNGEISADRSVIEDYMAAPWGTNGITNPLFESSSFRMHTANLDMSRAGKLPLLRRYPVALHALSFCKDYSFRPENCGVCSKCIRTKAMFLASDTALPDIFADSSFDKELFVHQELGQGSRVKLADIYNTARRNGLLGNFPGLRERLLAFSTPAKKSKAPKKVDGTGPGGKAEVKKKKRSWLRRLFSKST